MHILLSTIRDMRHNPWTWIGEALGVAIVFGAVFGLLAIMPCPSR